MNKTIQVRQISLFVVFLLTAGLLILARYISLSFFHEPDYATSNVLIICMTFMTYGIPLLMKNAIDEKFLKTAAAPAESSRLRFQLDRNFIKLGLLTVLGAACIMIVTYSFKALVLNFLVGFQGSTLEFLDTDEHEHSKLLIGQFLIAVISLGIVSPVFEELFFRKMMIDQYRFLSPWVTIPCSVLIFVMSHNNVSQILVSIPIGVFCGIVMYRTGSVVLCAILHGISNILSINGTEYDTLLFSYEYAAQYHENGTARLNCLFLLCIVTAAVILLMLVINRLPKKEAAETGTAKEETAKSALPAVLYIAVSLIFAAAVSILIKRG